MKSALRDFLPAPLHACCTEYPQYMPISTPTPKTPCHCRRGVPRPLRQWQGVFMMFSRLRRSIPLFRPSCIPWIRADRTCGRCRALCFSAYIVHMGNHLSLPNQSFGCSLSQRASRNSSFSTMRCCSGRGGRGIIVLIIFAFEIFGCAPPAPCLRKALRCDRRK